MSIRTIAVLGAGTMGHGIAHAAIAGGYDTRMFDVSKTAVDKGRGAVEQIVGKGVELGKTTAADGGAMLRRLVITTALDEALGGADFIIEASPEKIDLKLQLFEQIERLAPAPAVVASNTSALSITEMAGSLRDPGRVAGMHFFNPVHKLSLIHI